MFLINFGHLHHRCPARLHSRTAGRECERVIAVSTQFDYAQPFFEQVRELKERPTDPRTLPD